MAILSATMEEHEVRTFGSDENFLKVYGANFEFRNESLSCMIVLVVLSQIFIHHTHTSAYFYSSYEKAQKTEEKTGLRAHTWVARHEF